MGERGDGEAEKKSLPCRWAEGNGSTNTTARRVLATGPPLSRRTRQPSTPQHTTPHLQTTVQTNIVQHRRGPDHRARRCRGAFADFHSAKAERNNAHTQKRNTRTHHARAKQDTPAAKTPPTHRILIRGSVPTDRPAPARPAATPAARSLHHALRPAVVLAPPPLDERRAGMVLGGPLHLGDLLVHAELFSGAEEGHPRTIDRVLELAHHLFFWGGGGGVFGVSLLQDVQSVEHIGQPFLTPRG